MDTGTVIEPLSHETGVVFRREWAMPSADTFDIPCIAGFVQKYLLKSKVSIDPFARNKRWATYTNDLNPDTAATDHMDATDWLMSRNGFRVDLVLFDPPYSLNQAKEMYASVGRDFLQEDAQQVGRWVKAKDRISKMIIEGGYVLTFGWNSIGMGKERGFEIVEILLVAHGSAHNDTICMAERRKPKEPQLFDLC